MRVGFVGLGRMGLPMARNLARAGHVVYAYNRTASRAEALHREEGRVVVTRTPAEAARGCEVLITMLADDAAVEETVFRQEAISALPRGAVHVSMSTISAALSKRLEAAHRDAGQGYIAAPVFGRPEAAEGAKLWVVAGGDAALLERVRPVLDAVGQGVRVVGHEPWQANVVKLAGNFTIISMLETLGEAFALVRKNGIEPSLFLEIINGALFKSPLYENYGRFISEERFEPAGFALRLGLKDVRLALAAADAAEVPMPAASMIHDRMLSGVARGLGDLDWSAVGGIAAAAAGLPTRAGA